MKILFGALSAGIFALTGGMALAQDTGASVTINPLTVEGLSVGKRIVVDAAFAEQYGVAVPLPFEIIIPTIEGQNVYYDPAPGGDGILKVTFATSEDKVRSNIQIVPFTLGMAEPEARLQNARSLLQQALEVSIPDLDRAEVLIVQSFEMGPYPAIEVVAKYDGGADGLVILRVVAIPDPNSVNGLLVVMNTLVANNEMSTVTDILEFEAAKAMNSIRFQ
jgi:hypothetical protein